MNSRVLVAQTWENCGTGGTGCDTSLGWDGQLGGCRGDAVRGDQGCPMMDTAHSSHDQGPASGQSQAGDTGDTSGITYLRCK